MSLYTEQNGVVERKHRHIVEIVICLTSRASVPLKFWSFAFVILVVLINRLPSPFLKTKLPLNVLLNIPLNINTSKSYGYTCYQLLKPYNSHKLQQKTSQSVFLSYPLDHKGYLCYNMSLDKFSHPTM